VYDSYAQSMSYAHTYEQFLQLTAGLEFQVLFRPMFALYFGHSVAVFAFVVLELCLV